MAHTIPWLLILNILLTNYIVFFWFSILFKIVLLFSTICRLLASILRASFDVTSLLAPAWHVCRQAGNLDPVTPLIDPFSTITYVRFCVCPLHTSRARARISHIGVYAHHTHTLWWPTKKSARLTDSLGSTHIKKPAYVRANTNTHVLVCEINSFKNCIIFHIKLYNCFYFVVSDFNKLSCYI